MPDFDWGELAQQAGELTDNQFNSQISSLTKLNDQELTEIITDTGISKENLAEVLKIVKQATDDNNQKAQEISQITNGVASLVSIVKKII